MLLPSARAPRGGPALSHRGRALCLRLALLLTLQLLPWLLTQGPCSRLREGGCPALGAAPGPFFSLPRKKEGKLSSCTGHPPTVYRFPSADALWTELLPAAYTAHQPGPAARQVGGMLGGPDTPQPWPFPPLRGVGMGDGVLRDSWMLVSPNPHRCHCHRLLGKPGGLRAAPAPRPALHVLVGLPAVTVSKAGRACGWLTGEVATTQWHVPQR